MRQHIVQREAQRPERDSQRGGGSQVSGVFLFDLLGVSVCGAGVVGRRCRGVRQRGAVHDGGSRNHAVVGPAVETDWACVGS